MKVVVISHESLERERKRAVEISNLTTRFRHNYACMYLLGVIQTVLVINSCFSHVNTVQCDCEPSPGAFIHIQWLNTF